jgi:hypothetical protein
MSLRADFCVLTERLPCLDTLAPHAAARIALPVEMFTDPMLTCVHTYAPPEPSAARTGRHTRTRE